MFDKFKNYIKEKVLTIDTFSTLQSILTQDDSSPVYNRDNYINILNKLGGYIYIAGDIIAKQVASQKLRLYAKKPERLSKYHSGREIINCKNRPISPSIKRYLIGEREIKHPKIIEKTLSAENGIVEILEHSSLNVLQNINNYSNRWEFFYILTLSMLFYGNSFWQKRRNMNGEIVELWYAPSIGMDIKTGKTFDNYIDYYEWGRIYGQNIKINRDDILDFKLPNVMTSSVYGTSKVEIAWKYIQLIDSSLKFQKAVMDNHGRPDFLLIAKNANQNVKSLKRLQEKWNNAHLGSDKAGKMSVIPGDVSIQTLDRTIFEFDKDLPLVRAIGRAFGLPEYKLLGSSNIKANDAQQERDYKEETIDSYLTLIEEVLNEHFLTEWERSEDMFFAFDPVIQENKEFNLKKNISYVNAGIYSINDVLVSEGSDSVEGGDIRRINGVPITQTPTEKQIQQNQDSQQQIDISERIEYIISNLDDLKSIEKNDKSSQLTQSPFVINIGDIEEIEEINENNTEKKEGKIENKENKEESSELVSKITNKIQGIV